MMHYSPCYSIVFHLIISQGYEIEGLEKLPKHGPALLIFFHATYLPVDIMYFLAHVYLKKNRLVKAVVDKDLFNKIGKRIKK